MASKASILYKIKIIASHLFSMVRKTDTYLILVTLLKPIYQSNWMQLPYRLYILCIRGLTQGCANTNMNSTVNSWKVTRTWHPGTPLGWRRNTMSRKWPVAPWPCSSWEPVAGTTKSRWLNESMKSMLLGNTSFIVINSDWINELMPLDLEALWHIFDIFCSMELGFGSTECIAVALTCFAAGLWIWDLGELNVLVNHYTVTISYYLESFRWCSRCAFFFCITSYFFQPSTKRILKCVHCVLRSMFFQQLRSRPPHVGFGFTLQRFKPPVYRHLESACHRATMGRRPAKCYRYNKYLGRPCQK